MKKRSEEKQANKKNEEKLTLTESRLTPFAIFCLHLMEKEGLTTVELAKKIGMDRTQLSHYINGLYTPSVKNQKRITEALGVDYDAVIANGLDLTIAMAQDPDLKDFLETMYEFYKELSMFKMVDKLIERGEELVKLAYCD